MSFFSQMTKIRKRFRLYVCDNTLEPLLTLKLHRRANASEEIFDSALLERTKPSTVPCTQSHVPITTYCVGFLSAC
jgi:hypothetical protein